MAVLAAFVVLSDCWSRGKGKVFEFVGDTALISPTPSVCRSPPRCCGVWILPG